MSTATMHQTRPSHPKGPTHNGLFKGASLNTVITTTSSSRPSSPRLQQSHQPYPNSKTSQAAAKVQSSYASRPSSPAPSSTSAKGVHTYSPSYPHASIHPPLRLLTTATCIETITSLVSAQSPPHSPTFSSFGLPKSSSASSRANSILDGIQSALGGGLSSPTTSSPSSSTIKVPVSSSSYSAAKDSLADFSIPPSKRITNIPEGHDGPGVIRSRSNYVSFPNFDEIDFVDVSMVHNYEEEERAEQDGEEDEEDEEDDQPSWSEPGSLPDMSLHDDRMRVASSSMGSMGSSSGGRGMPLSPSQHWLLQLETYHELRVNGVEV
ncbi:hypothetical protein BGZ93_007565 [Podila epicladia]|nr:hypothetical protein BGZ92_005230 [Podila epicladia]KAG0099458.1 hypothetical protein BGZ93_007565 [Podila epicladia]